MTYTNQMTKEMREDGRVIINRLFEVMDEFADKWDTEDEFVSIPLAAMFLCISVISRIEDPKRAHRCMIITCAKLLENFDQLIKVVEKPKESSHGRNTGRSNGSRNNRIKAKSRAAS